MEKKLRKYQNTLVVSGTGVVLFGAWSMVKTIMYFTMAPFFAQALLELDVDETFNKSVVMGMIWCIIGGSLAIELLMRTYIGLSAIAEGKGKKKSWIYVLLAGALVIQYLMMLAQNLGTAQQVTGSETTTLITLILDLTSVYTMTEMLVSSVRVKRLRKAMS